LTAYPLLETRRKADFGLSAALPAASEANVYIQCGYHEPLPGIAPYVRRSFPQASVVANKLSIKEFQKPYYYISRTEISDCSQSFRADSTAGSLRLYHCNVAE